MKRVLLYIIALITLSTGMLRAQDIAGTWQGTLELESTKAPVDVLVLDRVKKPSEN